MNSEIAAHCAAIEECNQRGGRMLSVVDLLDAGTLSMDLAAYALAAIRKGCSIMVGAIPGGAGKTTVMGALLNFAPRSIRLVAADCQATIEAGMKKGAPRACYVCHEIGPGGYYAYLWGPELRRYFELAGAGHMLASNLHADTLGQAREQICIQNGVPERLFRRISIVFFLSVSARCGRFIRRIASAYESDGVTPHLQVWPKDQASVWHSRLVASGEVEEAAAALDALVASGARTQPEVRSFLVSNGFV